MLRRYLAILAFGGLFCARTTLQSESRSLTYWNGWYERGHKVGYLQTVVQRYSNRYRFERRGKLTTEMMGTLSVVTPNTVSETDKDFALRSFDFTMSTTGHQFHVQGVVRGGKLVMTVESGGQRQTSSLELAGPVYPLEALPNLIIARNLQPRTKYDIMVFDAMVQKPSNAQVELLGTERLTLRDTAHMALKVSLLAFGVPSLLWLDSSAVVLREESPPSSVMLLEPSSVATAAQPEEAAPDLMSLFAVRPNLPLDNPRQLKYLKLELTGIDPKGFDLSDESQKILNAAPLVLAIAPGLPRTASLSFPVVGETSGLTPSLTIQSDNALIVRKARELAAGRNDAVAVARTMNDWVFANLRQKAMPSMPSATDVLKTMEGDCNEHAVLLAALCRAVGIPAKVCVGLLYKDGFFWYHAWNKVYLGNWVPVDPTFGQFPVDATHLKLKEGELDQQAPVLTVVGSLGINIIEAR